MQMIANAQQFVLRALNGAYSLSVNFALPNPLMSIMCWETNAKSGVETLGSQYTQLNSVIAEINGTYDLQRNIHKPYLEIAYSDADGFRIDHKLPNNESNYGSYRYDKEASKWFITGLLTTQLDFPLGNMTVTLRSTQEERADIANAFGGLTKQSSNGPGKIIADFTARTKRRRVRKTQANSLTLAHFTR